MTARVKLIVRPWVPWLVALFISGCGPARPEARRDRPVMLFAAASTTNALDEVIRRFEGQSGVGVKASYAGSPALAQQIAYGARADVFVSANTKWADYLADRDLVAERRDLLGNRLVVVVPAGSRLDLRSPEDLLGHQVRRVALADYTAVPAGIYARQALKGLGLWEDLKDKVVAGSDVRQALSYVEAQAAEAGIVYATDARVSQKVNVAVKIPAEATGPIRYPVVLLRHGARHAGARSFYGYLNSSRAAGVFRKHGFRVKAAARPAVAR